ncbi:MAG: prepilin-type N-terminal cleavage/methylation domain-containing protein [Campylobacteraceae bacterium]
MQRKSAFTILELVFVIVIIGILAAILIPRMQTSRMQEAADQIVSHIRYTQHLAMQDDKFNPNDTNWFKQRWQIFFANTAGSGNSWSYMIFSDSAKGVTGTPDRSEHARNPLDSSKYLSGGYSAGNIAHDSKDATKEMNLGKSYGITSVLFGGGCTIGIRQQRLYFDYLGRPFYGNPNLQNSPYDTNRIIKARCTITIINDAGENRVIIIEPETGYAFVQ